ncbi:MAG: hypothetical protein LC775_05720, partial [Acidobacteria bacterium]|nr:hypothetical protein [Acidobacteriota bacterium]
GGNIEPFLMVGFRAALCCCSEPVTTLKGEQIVLEISSDAMATCAACARSDSVSAAGGND